MYDRHMAVGGSPVAHCAVAVAPAAPDHASTDVAEILLANSQSGRCTIWHETAASVALLFGNMCVHAALYGGSGPVTDEQIGKVPVEA
jgi:hypothetical protein